MSGIDLEFRASEGVGTALKVLHTLHLDWLIKAGTDRAELAMTLDGVETRQPIKGDHFLPCAPGEHDLKVAIVGNLGTEASSHLKVTVEAGKVAIVRFTSHMGQSTTLEAAGSRPV